MEISQKLGCVTALLVGFDRNNYDLLQSLFGKIKGVEYNIQHVESAHDAWSFLSENTYDICLLDTSREWKVCHSLIQHAYKKGIAAPFIFLSEQDDRSLDLEVMEAGGWGYLVISEITPGLLERTIRYAICKKSVKEEIQKSNVDLEKQIHERTKVLRNIILKLAMEVEARKKEEAKRLQTQHRLYQLADSIPGMVYQMKLTKDHRIEFVMASHVCEELFKVEEEDLVEDARLFLRTIPRSEQKQFLSTLVKSARSLEPWKWEGKIHVCKEEKHIELVARPEQKNDGSILWHGVMLDVSSRVAMEDQLIRARKLESIGRITAGVAHEILTPNHFITNNLLFLNKAMKSLSNVLERYKRLLCQAKERRLTHEEIEEATSFLEKSSIDFLMKELPKAVEESINGNKRIANIANAMREYSHPGSRRKKAEDINRAIENSLDVCRNEWKGVATIELDLDSQLPLVNCLLGEIKQVILNLIVNAVRAIEKKNSCQDLQKIKVSTRMLSHCIEIRVSDTGIGIAQDALPHIFDPFYTTSEIGKGTGQGLTIVHGIVVEKHGGSIDVQSEEQKGTTFYVRLPIGIEEFTEGNSAQDKYSDMIGEGAKVETFFE